MRISLIQVAAVGALALAALAGTSTAGPPAPSAPKTLTMITGDQPGRPSSAAARLFARLVATFSNDSLRVKIVYLPDSARNVRESKVADAAALGAIRSGDATLGLIPTRALPLLGVTSARALETPFVVTTVPRMEAATRGRLGADLLAGLPASGLTGLALVPESIRRPFSFGKPLTLPIDYRGLSIRAVPSSTMNDLLRALGARPIEAADPRRGIAAGTIMAAEFQLPGAADLLPAPATVTANVALMPKVNALMIRTSELQRLSPAQRAALTRAAADTRARTIASLDEAREAARYCAAGGSVTNAPAATTSTFRRLARPVRARMQAGGVSRSLIARVERAAAALPEKDIAACDPPAGFVSAPPGWAVTSLPPRGTFRIEISADEMRTAGLSESDIVLNSGVRVMTFAGTSGVTTNTNDSGRWRCAFRLALDRGLVRNTAATDSPCAGQPSFFSWKTAGENLKMRFLFDGETRVPAPLSDAHVWQRVR